MAKGAATYPLDEKTHGAAYPTHNNRGILNSTHVFFFFKGAHPTDPDTKIELHFFRNRITGDQTLERKRTTTNQNFKITNRDGSYKTEEILKRRRVNLSDIQPTQSETDLLQKGLNFCPTPPPPTVDDINNLRLLTPLPAH